MDRIKIKLKPQVRIGAHTYKIVYKPFLSQEEGFSGTANHRRQLIEIDPSYPPTGKMETLVHEVIHNISRVFVCKIDEDNIGRLGEGFTDFLYNYLGIEFDWSSITEIKEEE